MNRGVCIHEQTAVASATDLENSIANEENDSGSCDFNKSPDGIAANKDQSQTTKLIPSHDNALSF